MNAVSLKKQKNMPNPPRITEEDLKANGFAKGAGNAWYYPGDNQYPHIHLGVSPEPGAPTKRVVVFISISLRNRGQNLAECPPNKFDDFKYNENTPGIDWAGHEEDFKNKLELLRIVKAC